MRVALIQMPVGKDKAKNVALAQKWVEKAASDGAEVCVLPEMFCCPYDVNAFEAFSEEADGPAQKAMRELSEKLDILLVAGSIPEKSEGKLYNAAFVYESGKQIAKHRKAHMFDIAVKGGQHFRESSVLTPGDKATVFESRFGTMGLCVCFDFRFVELARKMALDGARVIFVPGAFNMTTGPAHWELLFRQRAVDNQLFTVGVAPARDHSGSYVSYGHSMAVDPWGTVVGQLGSEADILHLELNLGQIDEIRSQLPLMNARREDIY